MTIALDLPRMPARVAPWHATADRVFHTNAECVFVDLTPESEKCAGRGGRAPCPLCERLHRYGFEQELESVLPLF